MSPLFVSCEVEPMRSHDELLAEAEALADNLDDKEMARWGFVYSYIGNHEQRAIWQKLKSIEQRLKNIDRLVVALGVPILLSLLGILLNAFLG